MDLSQNNLPDIINSNIKYGHNEGIISKSILTDQILEEDGHIIIVIKFYRFESNEDEHQYLRTAEIVRQFSFVDVNGFTSNFLEEKNSHDKNNYSLYCLNKLYESIAHQNFVKFSEISSILTESLIKLLSTENLFTFYFGFLSQDKEDYEDSLILLDLLSKIKMTNNTLFNNCLAYVGDNNISKFEFKEEFQISENIFSELMFFIDNTYANMKQFYNQFETIENQKEKFFKLYTVIYNNNLITNAEHLKIITNIFDLIFLYFKSRARWKCLIKAKEEILKLNENIRKKSSKNECEEHPLNNNITEISKHEESFLDLDFLKSIHTNNYSNKNVQIKTKDKTDNQIQSNFNNISITSQNVASFRDYFGDEQEKVSFNINKTTKNNNKKINSSKNMKKKSMESLLSNLILKELQNNLTNTFKSVFSRLTIKHNLCSCDTQIEEENRKYFKKKLSESRIAYNQITSEYKAMATLQAKIDFDGLSRIGKKSDNKTFDLEYEKNKREVHLNFDNKILPDNIPNCSPSKTENGVLEKNKQIQQQIQPKIKQRLIDKFDNMDNVEHMF